MSTGGWGERGAERVGGKGGREGGGLTKYEAYCMAPLTHTRPLCNMNNLWCVHNQFVTRQKQSYNALFLKVCCYRNDL